MISMKSPKKSETARQSFPAPLTRATFSNSSPYQRTTAIECPPEGKGRPLSVNELARLKEWIEAGAIIGAGEPAMTGADTTEADHPKRPEPIAGAWTNTSGEIIQATLIRVGGATPFSAWTRRITPVRLIISILPPRPRSKNTPTRGPSQKGTNNAYSAGASLLRGYFCPQHRRGRGAECPRPTRHHATQP